MISPTGRENLRSRCITGTNARFAQDLVSLRAVALSWQTSVSLRLPVVILNPATAPPVPETTSGDCDALNCGSAERNGRW